MNKSTSKGNQLKMAGISVFSALVLVVTIGLCTSTAADTKTLVVLTPTEFSHLDVKEVLTGDQYMVKYHIYNRLYRFNEKLEPLKELVANDSVSADGTTWTFDLTPGAKFHDGSPCNAEAVKYTIERMFKGEGKMQKALFTPIKEIKVESDTRLVLVTEGIFPALRNNFAHPDAGIVCPKADQEMGEEKYGQHPVGAGPYKLEEWVRGSHITVSRFDEYYGPKPYFEKIIFKFVGDANTRMLMMETGEADVGLRLLPADVPRLKKNPEITVDRIMGRNIFFMLHCKKPPFDNMKVRQAVNYAVDKKAIVDRILSGAAIPAHSLVEAVQGTIDAGFYEYEPEKASTMIKEAGAEGAKVLLIAPTTRYLMDSEVAQAVAGYLRKAGLDVTVQTFGDWPSFVSAIRKGEFNMHMIGWGGSTGDPDNAYRLTIFGERAGKPWNVGSYANPEVDRLIVMGSKEIDQAKRAEIYADIQRRVWDDAPWLFLHRLTIFMARKSDIKGIVSQPGIEMPYFWLAHR